MLLFAFLEDLKDCQKASKPLKIFEIFNIFIDLQRQFNMGHFETVDLDSKHRQHSVKLTNNEVIVRHRSPFCQADSACLGVEREFRNVERAGQLRCDNGRPCGHKTVKLHQLLVEVLVMYLVCVSYDCYKHSTLTK